MPDKIFLLSPADLGGIRAGRLLSARARFPTAERLRTEGLTLEEAFCFLSSLYFRGKLTYARRFAGRDAAACIHVIAPGAGLVAPETRFSLDAMRRLRRVPVDPRSRAYRRPLEAHAGAVAEALGLDTQVILLGSIASGKYIDVLAPIFGARLMAPRRFVGIGDMSRGALMLQAAASGIELEYMPLHAAVRPGRNAR
jgi:hypothetical protein